MSLKLNKTSIILLALLAVLGVIYLLAPYSYEKCSTVSQENLYKLLYNTYAFWIIASVSYAFIASILWDKLSRRSFVLYLTLALLTFFFVSIILASLNTARVSSRDARRVSDIEQIRLALELYFDPNGNQYPVSLSSLSDTVNPACGGVVCMPQVPTDPLGGNYAYNVSGDRKFFVLGATLGEGAYKNDCYSKVRGRMAGAFREDVDGEVLGVQCDEPVYCLTP